jgi:hypothetical protein
MRFILPFILASAAIAAEGQTGTNDLRLEYNILPRSVSDSSTGELSDALGNKLSFGGTTKSKIDEANGLGLTYVAARTPAGKQFGYLLGVGLSANAFVDDETDGGDNYRTEALAVVLSASVGGQYAINENFRIEAMPFLGLGVTSTTETLSGPSFSNWSKREFEYTGIAFQYGVRANAVLSMTKGVQGIIGIGYIATNVREEYDENFYVGGFYRRIKYDGNYTARGAFGSLGIGLRF